MRIVIDTNIWISGLLWQGSPWRLLRLAEAGTVELCLTPAIVDEIAQVLSYPRLKPRLTELALAPVELIAHVISLATIFEPLIARETIVAADPDDDMCIICAFVSEASYIVTADRHLLAIGEYAEIPILTIDDYLARELPSP